MYAVTINNKKEVINLKENEEEEEWTCKEELLGLHYNLKIFNNTQKADLSYFKGKNRPQDYSENKNLNLKH